MAVHPSPDELSDFLLGKLPLEKCDVVAGHLEDCPPCQETMGRLESKSDTLLESVQDPVQAAPLDSACQHAMQKAMTFVGGTTDAPSITDSVASKSGEHDTHNGQAVVDKADNSMPEISPSAASSEAPRIPTVAEIVANLKAANLLSDDDWSTIKTDVATAADGRAFIKRLIERDTLTKFQAQFVYQGKTRGLAFGEYIVLDRIGAGGMGQVFKARHRRMDRVVALKVLAKSAMNSPEAVKRFQREAKAAARLIHPNIVTAFDAGEQAGVHFLVMEFVDGHDLSACIKQHGPLPVPQAVDAILQAARGLAFAHAEGVVHRDIKPANLLRDKKGVVRILDLGLARFDDPLGRGQDDGLTGSGAVMGTVDYMAPEQAFNTREAGPAADVYSLGCTLYRLLTGQSLYNGETVVQKILAHREQAIPSLSSASQAIPAALEKLYERMVAKKLEDRPTMVEIVQDLERIARGELSAKIVIDTQKAATAGRSASVRSASAGRGGKRPPVKWLAAAAGAAALLFFGVWVIIRDKDGNEVARFKAPEGSTVTMQNDAPAKPSTPPPVVPAAPAQSPKPSALPTVTASSIPRTGQTPPLAVAPFDATQAKVHQEAWAKHLGTTVETVNSIGAKMILIPPGEYLMGSTDEQVEAALKVAEEIKADQYTKDRIQKSERSQHKVVLTKPLLMGTTEVTVGQFKQFAAASSYQTEAEKEELKAKAAPPPPTTPDQPPPKPIQTYLNPGYVVADDSPAAVITWNDAVAYCNWLSTQEKLDPCYRPDGNTWQAWPGKSGYRLPTEAEWEYACRAGTTTQFSCGDDHQQLDEYGWYSTNAGGRTHAVGTKSPNPFGLFDMHGNLQEWCQDFFDLKWYAASPPNDPNGPASGSTRVLRGGSRNSFVSHCRSAYRDNPSPWSRSNHIGFRCVRVLAASAPTASVAASTPPVVTPAPASKPVGLAPEPAKAPFDATQAKAHQEAWAKRLGTTVETTNSVGVKMILIPPGEFLMGSSDEQLELAAKIGKELQAGDAQSDQYKINQRPQHRVVLTKPFLIGATEVTVGQFKKFAIAARYQTEAEKTPPPTKPAPPQPTPGQPTVEAKPVEAYFNPGFEVTDDSPASRVTWNDAAAYCNWLSEQEKLEPCYRPDGSTWSVVLGKNGYRLPTEAEWEYACRAGTTTQYSFGDEHKPFHLFAWHHANSAGRPRSVGTKVPNGFGLYDMHGNLEEWCLDFYDKDWYQHSPTTDPCNLSTGYDRVTRGGVWSNNPFTAQSAYRRYRAPSRADPYYGFRCVRTLDVLASTANVSSVTPPVITAPAAIPAQAADGAFDLIKLLDLSRDVHAGTWKADGGAIVSVATENSLFEVPTSLPREYQLTLTVRRAAGSVANKGLLIGLSVAGQRVDAGIDVSGGTTSGLSDVEGLEIKDPKNPTRVQGPRPLIDGPNLRTIVCTVRPPSIQVSVDGKTIIDFAEPALLHSNRMTRLFDSVYLETETAMRIERLEIKSLQTVDSWQPRINRERQFPPTGLALAPAQLKGVSRWQVDTVGTRSHLSCVAISPDGKQVACGNHQGQIRVYDPDTWRLIRCWSAHSVRTFPATITSLSWSPDGTQIASAGSDGLCLWQPDGTLVAIRSLGPTANVRDPRVCWSSDGSRLAVGFANTLRLFNRDGAVGPAFNTNIGGCNDLCFSPDGLQLVFSAGNKGNVINLDGSAGLELIGHEGGVTGVSWSKLGQIATVGSDKTLRFWGSDGKPGPVVRDLAQGNGTLRCVRWSPDGTRLIVGDNSPLFVVSPTGEVLAKESHGGLNLGGAAWSADGQRVAYVASSFQRGYHPGVWDLKGKPWNMPEYQPPPETLAWSPDGRHLAMSTYGGRKARIIHADGTVVFPPFPKGSGRGDFAWSPDSKRLALSSEKTILLFDVSDSSIVASPTVLKEGADLVRWSPDGQHLASRGGDKTIRLWNIDGTPGPVLQAEIGRGALAWLNPETLIAGDVDGNKKPVLQQWKIDGTKGPAWPVSSAPEHVAVSPDGTKLLVSTGNGGRLRLDLTSKESSRIGEGPGNSSWSKDGMQWLISSQNNHGGAVRLMDTATNKPIQVLPVFEPRMSELSPTGVITACASDFTVRAWESATGRPLWTTVCLNDHQSITLAADGRVLQHGDVKLDDVLFYSVECDDGRVDTLTHSEFCKLAPDYASAPQQAAEK